MKKLVIFLLTLVFCLGSSNIVFATEQFVSDGSATSTVVYHADSTYTVIIPEVINANSLMRLEASEMNIDTNEVVRVRVTNLSEAGHLQLTHENGSTANFTLYRDDTSSSISNYGEVATFTAGAMQSSLAVEFYRSTGTILTAGDYSGTITFEISLDDM